MLGYAATDPGQADPHQKFAYMVMDNDYADQGDPAAVMQVTAAHEYNHVLQFAYDAAQDTWMFESTAVWMEDRVYDAVDDYLGYIPTWATLDEIPLAKTFEDKHYGSAVWNMWLDAQHGPDLIRDAWEGSAGASPQSFAPGAYDAALTAGGHPGFSPSFVSFVADLAEWRTASAFPRAPCTPTRSAGGTSRRVARRSRRRWTTRPTPSTRSRSPRAAGPRCSGSTASSPRA